jgi:hypothetical protein
MHAQHMGLILILSRLRLCFFAFFCGVLVPCVFAFLHVLSLANLFTECMVCVAKLNVLCECMHASAVFLSLA